MSFSLKNVKCILKLSLAALKTSQIEKYVLFHILLRYMNAIFGIFLYTNCLIIQHNQRILEKNATQNWVTNHAFFQCHQTQHYWTFDENLPLRLDLIIFNFFFIFLRKMLVLFQHFLVISL